MKFTTRETVTAIKFNKGVLENGTGYDSTKVYVQTALDDSKDQGKGFVSAEYTWGSSANYHAVKHNPFPCECEIELEIVSNGKTQKTLITSLKPLGVAKKAA